MASVGPALPAYILGVGAVAASVWVVADVVRRWRGGASSSINHSSCDSCQQPQTGGIRIRTPAVSTDQLSATSYHFHPAYDQGKWQTLVEEWTHRPDLPVQVRSMIAKQADEVFDRRLAMLPEVTEPCAGGGSDPSLPPQRMTSPARWEVDDAHLLRGRRKSGSTVSANGTPKSPRNSVLMHHVPPIPTPVTQPQDWVQRQPTDGQTYVLYQHVSSGQLWAVNLHESTTCDHFEVYDNEDDFAKCMVLERILWDGSLSRVYHMSPAARRSSSSSTE